MCNAGFGWRQAFVRPALLMLGAAGAFMRVGKKLSCSNLYRLNRPVRLASAGRALKDEVCMARMSAALSGYLHITSNYITVRLACARKIQNEIRRLKPPDGACKDAVPIAIGRLAPDG